MKILLLFLLAALFGSCSKESFSNDPGARLTLFTDTLNFDTVFTSRGSVNQSFKIFNNNNKGIRIGSIRLGGGSTSAFRVNINGEPGPVIKDLEIAAGDSAYVFVTVTVNPNHAQLPFVVSDSLEFSYNGNKDVVQLQAYGQNARFLRGHIITGHEVWNKELPYVILDRLEVASGATLTIEKGSRIFIHAAAPVMVRGSLMVEGDSAAKDRVRFSGDRLDDSYRKLPGSWPGMRFLPGSNGNRMQYTIIENAYQGIVLETNSSGQSALLEIAETVIDHAFDAGIYSQNGTITGRNLLISNCGKNMVLAGGQYLFEHCTLAGYSTKYLLHKDPVLQLGNSSLVAGGLFTSGLSATFRNCIFWGEGNLVKNEVVLTPKQGVPFSVSFDHVLWKTEQQPVPAIVASAFNLNPGFRSAQSGDMLFDFRLEPGAPAINKGKATGLAIDLDGSPRPIGLPDLGPYELQ